VALLVLIDWLAHAVARCKTPALIVTVFIPFVSFLPKYFGLFAKYIMVYIWLPMVTETFAIYD
jgi:hypothetical protein